jgi:hypothetical protein
MGQWIQLKHNLCRKIAYQAILISFFSFLGTAQANCPNTQTNCPNPNVTQGYLGNLGTTAGNCQSTPLPPLCAFGSLSINQNSPLQSINRLNCTQLPTTNNFQLFQNPCAINQNIWTNSGISAGAGALRMRHGPFLIGMARTGPIATVAQFNFNSNVALPNLLADNRMTFFFSATETNQGQANDYFSIATNVVNSDTCILTYTPNNGAPGTITDYNITGNVFHDVYYKNLTPALGISNPSYTVGTNVYLSIDGGPVITVPFSTTVTGHYFQIFVNRYIPLGPASFVLYAVNANNNPITFKVVSAANDNMLFTATSPYTGFLRLAPLSTNDPNPTAGMTWTQQSFFMPEDVCNTADTSVPPMTMFCAMQGSTISPCPIESAACPLSPTSESWWKTAQVDALSTTGMSFYMLLPAGWSKLFSKLAVKTIGANWMNTSGTIQFPTSQALTCFLPALALADGLNATTFAAGYYNDFITAMTETPTLFRNGCDFSTNFFLIQFEMFMASNLASDINTFQSAQRVLPSYSITAPVNNIAVYTAASKYVPVRADISTAATSLTWTYTPSTDVPPPAGPFIPLMCFPFWKFLQGTIPGVVNTIPGGGQPLQNFIFNDTIKGTLYAATAINGAFTFLEGGIPSWYGAPGTFGPIDLFFSSNPASSAYLNFSPTQLNALQTALTRIQQTDIPLPYFPENFLDAAYNAGKTCFMLAKSALYIAYYMTRNGSSQAQIIAQTKPFADNAKSCLTAYLLGRTPGSSFFVADRTSGGICVNGAGGDGTWANGPNLQQFSPSAALTHNLDTGFDFGNYVYNDHHFFAGYFLLAAAIVTNWDMIYNSSQIWINLPVLGADNRTYKIRDMIDFLWRDTHNPFTNDSTKPIYDPDLPYDRYGLPWEGHGVANGLQYQPNVLGRNQESISEDFNCWLGMNTLAKLVLLTPLTAEETAKYQTLHDFSLMNLKLNASSGIQWYKNYTYWSPTNLFFTNPSSLAPAIYIGQFSQATVTNGQVNDQSAQNQTFF